MKPPQFTIASLMILVAVMAPCVTWCSTVLSWSSFGQLLLFAAIVGACHRGGKLKGLDLMLFTAGLACGWVLHQSSRLHSKLKYVLPLRATTSSRCWARCGSAGSGHF